MWTFKKRVPKKESPYLYGQGNGRRRVRNPKYNVHEHCKCGHAYHRHFSVNSLIREYGCSLCACTTFKVKDDAK